MPDQFEEFYSATGPRKYIDTEWAPATGKIKLIVFDFDKTITRKHTGGMVQLPGQTTDEYITKNFADLKFFRFVVPFIRAQNCAVGIASFGESDEDAILSGIPLIRKYLDIALGKDKSGDLIPDQYIALWHPESKKKDPKKVGKLEHLDELLRHFKQKNPKTPISPKNVALFDDDLDNIKIAAKKGYNVFHCKAVNAKDEVSDTGFNRHVWLDFVGKKGISGEGCSIM
eukprot:m.14894 g.14894  ORF g.14894 m.14894 type:complete len:228 (-) comp5243_c0_seq1:158-841(-)